MLRSNLAYVCCIKVGVQLKILIKSLSSED
jgi:hypothetical protein